MQDVVGWLQGSELGWVDRTADKHAAELSDKAMSPIFGLRGPSPKDRLPYLILRGPSSSAGVPVRPKPFTRSTRVAKIPRCGCGPSFNLIILGRFGNTVSCLPSHLNSAAFSSITNLLARRAFSS